MRGRWPKAILTPSLLCRILKKQKNPLRALSLFQDAKTRYPNYSHNSQVYATMITILGASNRTSEIKQVVEILKHDSCQFTDPIIVSTLNIYTNSDLLDDAISLFQDLPLFNCIDWTDSFHTLLHTLLTRSQIPEACTLFFRHFFDPEIHSRTRSFNFIISLLCRSRLSDTALLLFGEMHKQCCLPDEDTYSALMEGLCAEKRLQDADHLIKSMFWRFSRKGGSGKDVVIYRTLLNTLVDSGRLEQAVSLVGRIMKKGMKAPGRHCTDSGGRFLLGLIRECITTGEVEKAKGLLRGAMMREGVAGQRSYCYMAVALYEEGDLKGGDEVMEEMAKSGFKAWVEVYEAKVEAMCRGGEVEGAKKEVADKGGGTVRMYNSLMRGLYREGRWREGLDYMGKMERRLGCVPDRDTYSLTMEGLRETGRFVEMSGIMDRMIRESFVPSVAVYSCVISGLCGMGRSYEGFVWLEEMLSRCLLPCISAWTSLVSSSCHSTSEAHRCSRFVNLLLSWCRTKLE